ncbi:Midasin [Frankliniella fusca]|uniref:Regulatory protein zeste n=1 Tax=Frankliniella fusca TaxID=407009 RepID=A0AAE1L9F1_9NEOP|nr:Midasin [Frankliniella fusca]
MAAMAIEAEIDVEVFSGSATMKSNGETIEAVMGRLNITIPDEVKMASHAIAERQGGQDGTEYGSAEEDEQDDRDSDDGDSDNDDRGGRGGGTGGAGCGHSHSSSDEGDVQDQDDKDDHGGHGESTYDQEGTSSSAMARVTDEQKNFLLAYMEKNVKFSQREYYSLTGKKTLQEDWKTLSASLNSLPGSQKSVAEWQRYWCDQRAGVKQRAREVNHFNRGTGGGPPTELLSNYDQRLLACIGGWKRVQGIMGVKDTLEIKRKKFWPCSLNRRSHSRSRSPSRRRI